MYKLSIMCSLTDKLGIMKELELVHLPDDYYYSCLARSAKGNNL